MGGTRVDAIGTEVVVGDRRGPGGIDDDGTDELCRMESLVGAGGTLPDILRILSPPIIAGGKRGRAIVKRVG